MRARAHECMHVYIHTCGACTCVHVCMHVHPQTCSARVRLLVLHLHMRTCTRTHILSHTLTYINISTHIYILFGLQKTIYSVCLCRQSDSENTAQEPLELHMCPSCQMHYTATHCNTLQHTATHCNTLQHTVTRCNALQHIATLCNMLQRINAWTIL